MNYLLITLNQHGKLQKHYAEQKKLDLKHCIRVHLDDILEENLQGQKADQSPTGAVCGERSCLQSA